MLQVIIEYILGHKLEVFSMVIGLVYLWCEYRASILVWIVGVIMPIIDIVLYWQNGLYADSVMDGYYAVAAVWGFVAWKWGKKNKSNNYDISHYPVRKLFPVFIVFLAIWGIIYLWLVYGTPSNVPIMDSFINALCIIGLWALSRKYLEQWYIWIVVDVLKTFLYAYKGIPVKGSYYALSAIIAVFGYFKWKKMLSLQHNT